MIQVAGAFVVKNVFLSDERVGNLLFVVNNPERLSVVRTQLVLIVRETWSNPPAFGARIVSTILNNPQLNREWYGFRTHLVVVRVIYCTLDSLSVLNYWSLE